MHPAEKLVGLSIIMFPFYFNHTITFPIFRPSQVDVFVGFRLQMGCRLRELQRSTSRNAIKLKVAVTVYARTVLPMAWAPQSIDNRWCSHGQIHHLKGFMIQGDWGESTESGKCCFCFNSGSMDSANPRWICQIPARGEVKALASPLIKDFISLNAFNKAMSSEGKMGGLSRHQSLEAQETRDLSLGGQTFLCSDTFFGLEYQAIRVFRSQEAPSIHNVFSHYRASVARELELRPCSSESKNPRSGPCQPLKNDFNDCKTIIFSSIINHHKTYSMVGGRCWFMLVLGCFRYLVSVCFRWDHDLPSRRWIAAHWLKKAYAWKNPQDLCDTHGFMVQLLQPLFNFKKRRSSSLQSINLEDM